MRAVDIAALKRHLRAYLDEVASGEEIIIRNRRGPIAKIVPWGMSLEQVEERALIAAGLMRSPQEGLTEAFWKLPMPRVTSTGRAMAAIRWARGTR